MNLEVILECARDLLSETGCHPPTLWLEGTRGVVMAPILCFSKEQERRLQELQGIGEWMASHGEIGKLMTVALIGEAWYWTRPVESEQQPSPQTPQRKGGLLLFDLDVESGAQQATLYEVSEGVGLRPIPRFQGKETQYALLPALVTGYRRTRSRWN